MWIPLFLCVIWHCTNHRAAHHSSLVFPDRARGGSHGHDGLFCALVKTSLTISSATNVLCLEQTQLATGAFAKASSPAETCRFIFPASSSPSQPVSKGQLCKGLRSCKRWQSSPLKTVKKAAVACTVCAHFPVVRTSLQSQRCTLRRWHACTCFKDYI